MIIVLDTFPVGGYFLQGATARDRKESRVTIVTVDASGGIDLPEAVLQASRVQPGSQLVVLAREGRIILLDAERFRERVEKPAGAIPYSGDFGLLAVIHFR